MNQKKNKETIIYVPDKRPAYEKSAPRDGFLYGWDDKNKEWVKTEKLLADCKGYPQLIHSSDKMPTNKAL